MLLSRRLPLALASLAVALAAAPALAADKCVVKVVIGGEAAELKHCAVAVYDEQGVTLFFSETPIEKDEQETFEFSSYAKDRDPSGKPRTMMHVGFCPGGGKPGVNAGAVRSVELSMSSATSPMLQRQWLFELPKDKELKIPALAGTLAPGGRLSGRITGDKTSAGQEYSWDAEFDLAIPAKKAAAGVGCGN